MIATLALKKNVLLTGKTVVSIRDIDRSKLAAQLAKLTQDICQETNPDQLAAFAAKEMSGILDAHAFSKIRAFKSSGAPFLLIKGAIDTANLPPTPTNDTPPHTASWRVQASTMLGALKLCDANARSFNDEMGGRLFHMVMPAQNDTRSMLRSTKALNFHTEVVNGFFREDEPMFGSPIAPEMFALGSLRNPQYVPTTLLPLAEVLAQLSSEAKRLLQLPNFVANSQSSFDREIVSNNVSVLVRLTTGKLGIRYSNSKLAATCSGSAMALEELRHVIASFDESWSVTLEPGDLLILNNRLCLHGRGEVGSSSQFNGNDRWLLRLYGYGESTLRLLRTDSQRSHVMSVDNPQYPMLRSA